MSDKTDDKAPDSAVALKYDMVGDNAPSVTAKGEGHLAERIIAIAKDAGIPIHQDPDLINLLQSVEINQEIPVEAFTVVAEILSYLYRANADWPEEPSPS